MKKIIGTIALIVLILVLLFSFYMRDNTPDRKAIKNIENAALGSGDLFVKENLPSDEGYHVLIFGDDVYDYTVKAETGALLGIHINDRSRQKLDKALVESGGERISEEQANEILEDILNRYFPQADRDNVSLKRTGNHLEEFIYTAVSPLANGETGPVYIALAFNGELSGISTVSEAAVEPELQREEPAESGPSEPQPTEVIALEEENTN